jgi:hypothetical protein
MQVQVEALLQSGAADLGDKPAGAGQRLAVEADAMAQRHQFVRRAAGADARVPRAPLGG